MIAGLTAHLWASTLFLGLLLAIVALARKRLTAGARFWLALIGIAKFAVPGSILAPLMASAPQPIRVPSVLLGGGLAAAAATPQAAPPLWPWIAAGVWAAVALALVLRFALTRHRLVAFAMRTARPAEPREIDALARARRFLGIRRSIDIARSSLPEAPAVLRTIRPLVVLPSNGCDELDDSELESLLRHECAHVARHDNLIARIESLICALFWFHPLIWIAQRITAIERERACDERVAASADERDTYLAALAKFCHASIAPRLPGVSCMATANLKERIDHVMNYELLQAHAPSPRRVALIAAFALVLFTVASAMMGVQRTTAPTTVKVGDVAYTIDGNAKQSGDRITFYGTVRVSKSGQLVAAPAVNFKKGDSASASIKDAGRDVFFNIHPHTDNQIIVDVIIRQDGRDVGNASLTIRPADVTEGGKYTGDSISLNLKGADLRDVLKMFGKLTNLEMKIDDDVQGKVDVDWRDVPWDKALDVLLQEQGCTYKIEGHTIHVSKR